VHFVPDAFVEQERFAVLGRVNNMHNDVGQGLRRGWPFQLTWLDDGSRGDEDRLSAAIGPYGDSAA
jgi:hypothetical protein